jgi:hypothetical protein
LCGVREVRFIQSPGFELAQEAEKITYALVMYLGDLTPVGPIDISMNLFGQNSVPIQPNRRGIVLTETHVCEPSKGDFEKMARRRYQAPKPKRRGKWWTLLYWQDVFIEGRRTRQWKRLKLAPASLPEREVNQIAAEHLRPMNQGLITVGSATNFVEFVDNVYTPVVLSKMARSTQDRYAGVIQNYLKPQFGDHC